MLLFVTEIRTAGLVLAPPGTEGGRFWLPGAERDETDSPWEEFRDSAVLGMAVNVTQIPGRYAPGSERLQVVTIRGSGAKDLSTAWKGEVHGLLVESLSKNMIQGRIGAIKAAMDRDEYTAFLNRFPQNNHIQDHGALALGDLICGVFKGEGGSEGRVQISFTDALLMIERETEKRGQTQESRKSEQTDVENTQVQLLQGSLFRTSHEDLSPLLFVENDELCRDMWTRILTHDGVEVVAFATYEAALEVLRSSDRKFKMAIVDVHLMPGAADYLGIGFAREILSTQPDCRIVLSSAENDEQKRDAWGDLRMSRYWGRSSTFYNSARG